MKNSLTDAKEEFKRCDHLLYVSLKYTRTVDVIKSLIGRMISCYGFILDALIMEKKKEIPIQMGLKIDLAKKLYEDDDVISKNIDFFIYLRKLDKADYKREREFRRHVHLLANLENRTAIIGIDQMSEFYMQLKELLEYLEDEPE